MPKNKMIDDEILDILIAESEEAIGPHEGDLQRDTEKAHDYYMGKKYGDEIDGKSQFVTRETLETIESIMPYLVKTFFSTDQACIFEPEDEDDVPIAEQETEYVKWVFYKKNKGFKIGYTWIKDALLNKLAVVKAVREGYFGVKIKKYQNLTDVQISKILGDLDQEEIKDFSIEQTEDNLFNMEVKEINNDNKTVIYNIPPENFRVSDSGHDIQELRYTGEVYEKTISELRAQGFDVEDDISDSSDERALDIVKSSRMEDVDEGNLFSDNATKSDPSARTVSVSEEYTFLDVDDDGIAELIKTIRVGRNLLLNETVEVRPYYGWSAVMVPHRLHGMSAADLVMDIQLLRSKFFRNILDNQFLQNNGRYTVIDGQVNLDDIMESTPHGIVRQNFDGAVGVLPTPQLGPDAFNMLSYTDQLQERRAGVSERSAGLDPKAFNSNTTLGNTEIIMAAAEQKVELIARIFAECGLKELFMGLQRLGSFEKPGVKIRTNNGSFIPINPEEWRERTDMTVTVGIGNGSKNQQVSQIGAIAATQQAVVSGGGLGTLVTPTNVYNLAIEQSKAVGRKDGSQFFTKPESDEIDKGPSVEEQIKLAELKNDEVKIQIEAKEIQERLELSAAEQILNEQRLEFEKEELAFKIRQHEDENEFKILEAQIEINQQRAAKLGDER